MKIFQIKDGFCHWDATQKFPMLESTKGRFPTDVLFVEAPDYVREGWGYLDGEFIQPQPPEGWAYDMETGTFYPIGETAPSQEPTRLDVIEAQITYTAMMTDTLLEV